MRRWVVLLALAACEPPVPPAEPPPPRWTYPPPPPAWPLGELRGRFGRSQAPQPGLVAGIAGDPKLVPLRLPTPWAVLGDGPARAVIDGLEVDRPAIEMIDVDQGIVVWRSTTACAGPIVGVTADSIVCSDATGVRGVKVADGEVAWRSRARFIAISDDRVVVAGDGEAIVLGAARGDELARVKMPAGIPVEAVIATCGEAGRELFGTGRDGKLVHIDEVKGATAITWTLPMGAIMGIDACEGDAVLLTVPGDAGAALVSVARETGKITGRVDGIRGYWPSRQHGDLARLEIATSSGVAAWTRDLAVAPEVLALAPLGELLAKRGELRLVRATPLTAAVLDRGGVRAYVPLAAMGAVLGDHAIVSASWLGSNGETVRRIGLPLHPPRGLRVPSRRPGVAVPAELRDLPPPRPLDLTSAIAKPDTGKHATFAVAIDPQESAVLYTAPLERPPDDKVGAGLARIDLVKRDWTWQRVDGCGEGTPLALAVAHDVVVCGSRGSRTGTAVVRATTREGVARWDFETANLDMVEAAGDTVLVHDADRLFVLDAATGRVRGTIVSDDGAAVRAAAIELDDVTMIITYERGRLVARLPRNELVPVWSLAVDGVVRAVSPSNQGVLVELEDGDAVRIDARTGEITGIPGLGLVWRAAADVITGQAVGGPIPAPPKPIAPRPVVVPRLRPQVRDPYAAPMSTPVQPPPPIGDSVQYSLYELSGGLRARNDYAVTGLVAQAARGPAGSPLVLTSGIGMREVLVLDPRNGDPLRRVQLPDDAPPGLVFSTVVGGTPVAGTLLAAPLRVVLF